MIFNEWTYGLFLLVSVAGFAVAPRRHRALWLSLMGGLFYAFYGGVWLVVFLIEIAISRFYGPRSKVSIFGLIQALLILLVVKYGAFFANLMGAALERFGLPAYATVPPLPLPLGLSFFIFEFIHYTADRYNDRVEKLPQATYASFILFFPTMIAGPIKRAQNYVSSLGCAEVNASNLWSGVARITLGLVKKSVLADNINVFLDGAFAPNVPTAASYPTLVFRIFLYSWRIYLDFSSYSDIAIGSAKLFGISVPENFNWPYLARNPSEFWRRWHISLSKWITDYIFIPLGGSRGDALRTSFNIVVALGLSGLWHGAAGNFFVWGIYHAAYLVAYRLLVPYWERLLPVGLRESLPLRLSYVATNYAAVVFGWIFFAMPFDTALRYSARLLLLG